MRGKWFSQKKPFPLGAIYETKQKTQDNCPFERGSMNVRAEHAVTKTRGPVPCYIVFVGLYIMVMFPSDLPGASKPAQGKLATMPEL